MALYYRSDLTLYSQEDIIIAGFQIDFVWRNITQTDVQIIQIQQADLSYEEVTTNVSWQ